MNDTIALRPLRNVFVDGEFVDGSDTIVVHGIDIDRIAAHVFATIDADESLHPFRAAIAKNFADAQTDWLTGGGSAEELEAARTTFAKQLETSLASACSIAGAPDLPLAAVTSVGNAPLPSNPSLADLRKWICTWKLLANLGPFDIDQSNLGPPLPSRPHATDLTEYEIALLRAQRDPAAHVEVLASTKIARPALAAYEGDLDGLEELSVTLDLPEPLAVWCAITRNSGPGVNPAFIYRLVSSLNVDPPLVIHPEPIDLPSACGLPSASLEEYMSRLGTELLPADPSALIAIAYAAFPETIPIALVPPGAFDATAVAEAIQHWFAEEIVEPADGARVEFAVNGRQLSVTLLLPLRNAAVLGGWPGGVSPPPR